VTNPLILNERSQSGKKCLQRGVKLFRQLFDLARQGEAVGVSYAQFVCYLHGVSSFEDIAHRSYVRADTPLVLQLAKQVTDAVGGRQPITREGTTIRVGMDSFIWRKDKPHVRPRASFTGTPYTETEWKKVFPDGERRLLKPDEFLA